MMRIGFTEIRDIDNYLLKFLSLDCLMKIIQINKYIYDIVVGSRIYQQYSELKTVDPDDRLEYIIKKGYIKIIKHNETLNRIITNNNPTKEVTLFASKYGQLKIFKYLYARISLDITVNDYEPIALASRNGNL